MNARDFLIAGIERWKDSLALFNSDSDRLYGACYLAGYTAECILKYVIIKHRNLGDYQNIQRLLNSEKEICIEKLKRGEKVKWHDYEFDKIEDFKNTTGKYNCLKDHNIDTLFMLANSTKVFNRLNMTMVNKSAKDVKLWYSEWRYGKHYFVEKGFLTPTEIITREKTLEFLKQVKWFIDEIKNDTNDLTISIDNIDDLKGDIANESTSGN